MDSVEIVRTLSKVIIYVTLFVLYLWFYMLDQTQEYVKAKTSFATKFEDTVSYEVPSLVLCPQPEFKPSMVTKYEYQSMADLTYDYKEKYFNYNLSVWQMYQEMTYKLGQEIHISTFHFDDQTEKLEIVNLKEGHNILGLDKYIHLEPIATFRHGMCVLIKTKLNETSFRLLIRFSRELPVAMTVYLTDQNTWQGVVDDDWPYFQPTKYILPIQANTSTGWSFKLTSHVTEYIEHESQSPNECQETVLSKANCSQVCFPLTFNYLNLPACETYEEVQCMVQQIYLPSGPLERVRYPCLKPSKMTEFEGESFRKSHEVSEETIMLLVAYFLPTKKEVKEETLVLGTREYIGYIGGSLGLLLGFSCYAYITKLIDKVLDSFLSTA